MMDGPKRGLMLWSFLALILVFILVTCVACWGDPSFEMIFENQSQDKLTIYVNNREVGDVNLGEQIETWFPITITKFQIVAKNPDGELSSLKH